MENAFMLATMTDPFIVKAYIFQFLRLDTPKSLMKHVLSQDPDCWPDCTNAEDTWSKNSSKASIALD